MAEDAKKQMKVLSRDDIRALDDSVRVPVEIPEWGGVVYVRSMTALERDRFEASLIEMRKGKQRLNLDNARARLAVMVCVDENGKPLFQQSDVGWLAAKNAAALDRIFEVASDLSRLSADDVEELTKN